MQLAPLLKCVSPVKIFSYSRHMPPLRHRLCMFSVLVLHEKLSLTHIRAQCTGHMLRIWKLLWEYVSFPYPIVTAARVSLLDGILKMDKPASLKSVEVLSLNKWEDAFKPIAPWAAFGCLLFLWSRLMCTDLCCSVGSGMTQERAIPACLEEPQNNFKAIPFVCSFLIFPNELTK